MKEGRMQRNAKPKKKRHIIRKIVILILIMAVAAGATYYYLNQEEIKAIGSFEECVSYGFPAIDTKPLTEAVPQVGEYPRQCIAIDARIFSEEPGEKCVSYLDCIEGSYCKKNRCREFSPESRCITDEDCMLIDEAYGFSCCWAGRCDTIDMSQSNWIAVSERWFTDNRSVVCPAEEDCGPAPMCPTKVIDDNYSAKCFSGVCRKYSGSRDCIDACGDGVCQQGSCESADCVCPETRERCRMDCAKPGVPNPAAEYCKEKGGAHQVQTDPEGLESGACLLPDGTECDEWAYYTGKCGSIIDVVPGISFSLRINQTAEIKARGVSIQFLEVSEESRCPRGAECVWPGRVVALFSVTEDKKHSTHNLTLRGGEAQTEQILAGRYMIKVIDVLPYPEAGKSILAEDYHSEINITRTTSSEMDYSCSSVEDCSIKDVGNLCGRYDVCVNKNYLPNPPELDSSACGFPEIDGCACINKRCIGTLGGRISIN